MADEIEIAYRFEFENASEREFRLRLKRGDLSLDRADGSAPPPAWTELARNRCTNCTLDEACKYCPIAVNLSEIAEAFRDFFAYEKVKVSVTTEERTFSKDTIIQEGLGGLIGIIMVTSGCPVMEYLKPMARFHLPFASLSETIYRIASMHLMSQFFRKEQGLDADWNMAAIEKIYAEVSVLNRDFFQRLSEAAKKDANVNALVNLDCFASMVPLAVEDTLNELKSYFGAYLK